MKQAKEQGFIIKFGVLYVSPIEDNQVEIDNDIGYIEGVLIRKHMPPLNTQIPKEYDWHKYTYNRSA